MSWLRAASWFVRIMLPVNLVCAAAVIGALNYPVFRLRTVAVSYLDGHEVSPETGDWVRQCVHLSPDSNLFSIAPALVARLLLHHEDLARADVRLEPPDRLRVRLTAAQAALWYAEDGRVTTVAADGRPVPSVGSVNLPVAVVGGSADSPLARGRVMDVYRRLRQHDSRWPEVVAQISYDSLYGWQLVLNRGGELIRLGREGTTETLDRVARFLERIPEKDWEHRVIDARFTDRIVVVSPADSSDTAKATTRAAERDTTSSGGRS